MANVGIDIPVTVANAANAPTVDLSAFDAEIRTFNYTGPAGATVSIFASGNGVNFSGGPLLVLAANSKPIPMNDRSLRYRAVPSAAGGQLTVDVGPANDGGTVGHFNTLQLPDFPTGGLVTTAQNLAAFGAFTIAQTTAGQTLTFPAPTDPSATYVRWVSNIGTQAFALYGLLVLAGSATKIIWTGSAWVNGCVGTSTPTRSVLSAAGVNILDSNGQTTSIGNNNAAVAGSRLELFAGSGDLTFVADDIGRIQIFTGAGQVEIDSTGGAINIGRTDPSAKTVNIGSESGAAATNIFTGTGDLNLGTNLTEHDVNIGSSVATSSVTLVAGSQGITMAASGGVAVGGAVAASAEFAVTSTTKGLLLPRMTSVQRDAIAAPASGLLIYNTTTNKLNFRAAAAWEAVTSA